MKSFIVGVGLFSLPFFSAAEIIVVSEILIGQSQNKVHSSLQTETLENSYSSSLKSNSFGFRLGAKLTESLSLELAKHFHGSVVNRFKATIPIMAPPRTINSALLPSGFYRTVQANIPIDLESIRFGVKGEFELLTDTFINGRLGIAHWEYGEYTPQQLSNVSGSSNSGESGNNIYYSIGAEYKFTENFYLGIEYSLLSINVSYGNEYYVTSSYEHDVKDLSLVIGWEF